MTNSHFDLINKLSEHNEWLLTNSVGVSFALQRDEFEVTAERDRILLGFLADSGWQKWRVLTLRERGAALEIELAGRFGAARERIRLVPRIAAGELGAVVELARIEKAEQLAREVLKSRPRLKLLRVALNRENGRLAQVLVERPDGGHSVVLADVSELLAPEMLITAALLALRNFGRRRRNRIDDIWLATPVRNALRLARLHALLTPEWKRRIRICEMRGAGDTEPIPFRELAPVAMEELWRGKPEKTGNLTVTEPSETAERLIALAPDAIDHISSRHGLTLRYHGLPFVRLRTVLGRERIWFGAENPRQPLTTDNGHELDHLISSLAEFRSGDAPSRRHHFYRTAPEAWLESLLRRDIRRLDANLVLSPVYHQFRAGRERVDLLALRSDGRLVIIEIKTETDREMVMQAADYWRKLEHLRRCGELSDAGLFGGREIADAPAICYLLAPTLSFHRDFWFLASTLAPDIEIHRFNLAENWRKKLKVIDRQSRAAASR